MTEGAEAGGPAEIAEQGQGSRLDAAGSRGRRPADDPDDAAADPAVDPADDAATEETEAGLEADPEAGPEAADVELDDQPLAPPRSFPVSLPASMRDAVIDHARAGYPNEACGLIVGTAPAADGGRPLRFEANRNAAESPFRYEIAPEDLLRISLAADDADQVIWGIVHSHTHTSARPSPTDIGLAFYPDALYIIVSLAEEEADAATGLPGVRAWRIVGGEVTEVDLSFSGT